MNKVAGGESSGLTRYVGAGERVLGSRGSLASLAPDGQTLSGQVDRQATRVHYEIRYQVTLVLPEVARLQGSKVAVL